MGSMNLENKTTALDDDAAIYQHTEATETAKSLRQKLSEMTFKEKVRYLLDYYGLKALIVLAVLVFLGYTLWAMLRPKPETVAQIAIIDNPWDTSLLDDYQEELIEKLKLDTKKQELPLGYSYRSSNLSDGTALSTFLFANNLDILISSKAEISRYAENGVFYPLEDNLPADLKAVISEEDCLRCAYRNENGDGDGAEHVYAIRIDSSAFVQKVSATGYTAADYYLGIHPCSEARLACCFNILRIIYGLPLPE